MKFDVCLEMLFTDLPYDQRIPRIADCGFDAVEFWFHDGTFNGKDCSGGGRTRPRSEASVPRRE